MKKTVLTIVLLLMSLTGTIYGGGFQLNEHGARAMAFGGAFTAIADDPSAIYFNGAGLNWLTGTHIMAGTSLIAPMASFRGVYPSVTQYDAKAQVFFPSHFYATHTYDEQWAFGFGFTTPFGLGTEWDDTWPGRFLAVKTDLMVFTMSPVVSYRFMENLSFSAAFVYSFASVKISQKTSQSPFTGEAFVKLEGNDHSAFGYNLGLMYKPIPKLSLGVSFHSEVNYDFKGTAITEGSPQLASRLPNGDITAELTTPMNLVFGAAYEIMPELKVSADFQYVGWSSYDTLGVDFADAKFTDIASPRMYENSFIVRFGAEYLLMHNLRAQGGIYYDKNPVKPEYLNPSLPDADRIGMSIGLDYKFTKQFSISASYLFIRASQLTVTNSKESYTPGFTPFNGTYNSYANIGSISFSYGF